VRLATAAKWAAPIWIVAIIVFGLLALTDPASNIDSIWQFSLRAILAYPICVLFTWAIGERLARLRRDIPAFRRGRDE